MTRQAQCSECGQWYYNHNGLMIVLDDTYDDRKCPNCNHKIRKEIEKSKLTNSTKQFKH